MDWKKKWDDLKARYLDPATVFTILAALCAYFSGMHWPELLAVLVPFLLDHISKQLTGTEAKDLWDTATSRAFVLGALGMVMLGLHKIDITVFEAVYAPLILTRSAVNFRAKKNLGTPTEEDAPTDEGADHAAN